MRLRESRDLVGPALVRPGSMRVADPVIGVTNLGSV